MLEIVRFFKTYQYVLIIIEVIASIGKKGGRLKLLDGCPPNLRLDDLPSFNVAGEAPVVGVASASKSRKTVEIFKPV